MVPHASNLEVPETMKISRSSIPVDRLSDVPRLLAASIASETHARRGTPEDIRGGIRTLESQGLLESIRLSLSQIH